MPIFLFFSNSASASCINNLLPLHSFGALSHETAIFQFRGRQYVSRIRDSSRHHGHRPLICTAGLQQKNLLSPTVGNYYRPAAIPATAVPTIVAAAAAATEALAVRQIPLLVLSVSTGLDPGERVAPTAPELGMGVASAVPDSGDGVASTGTPEPGDGVASTGTPESGDGVASTGTLEAGDGVTPTGPEPPDTACVGLTFRPAVGFTGGRCDAIELSTHSVGCNKKKRLHGQHLVSEV